MKAFDLTTPVVDKIATWIWRILMDEALPTQGDVTVRVFGEPLATGLEDYLNNKYSACSWFVYFYPAAEAQIEFLSNNQKVTYKKCNQQVSFDTMQVYSVSHLSEMERKTWREWLKIYDPSPYPMMLPNAETSSLMLDWFKRSKLLDESLIKDDYIDAFVSASETAVRRDLHCQNELLQAAIIGVVFWARLTNQPERVISEKWAEALNLFSNITTISIDTLTMIDEWVTNDYIQDKN